MEDLRRSFTLIELIMTIVIVSIVAIALSLALSQHIESVFYSEDLTVAVNLARLEMERVNNMVYEDINSASFPNFEGYGYDVSRTVSYEYGGPLTPESLKRITVEVTKSGSSTVIVDLVTYVAKNVSYGL